MDLHDAAKSIEESEGLRKFGSCPICDDFIQKDGSCYYCDWNDKLTPKETAEMYNGYWVKGRVKPGYERPPKKPEDFMEKL